MNKEEFYRRVDRILGVETYVEAPKYYKRWGQRKLGNGRYQGFGLVKYYGPDLISIATYGFSRVYHDPQSAIDALSEMRKKTMKKYLVKFQRDWGDEFDVYGMAIINEDQKADWHELVADFPERSFTYWFGTNEGFGSDYGETVESFIDNYQFIEVTDDEAAVLTKCWGGDEYGHFPNLLFEAMEDNEDIMTRFADHE